MRTPRRIETADWQLPPPIHLKRRREKLRTFFESRALPDPQPWDEDATVFEPCLFLDATTFEMQAIFDLPPAKLEEIARKDTFLVSPAGSFAYQNRILHVGTPLDLHSHGFVLFSDDVSIPMLIDLQRDAEGRQFDEDVELSARVFFGNAWMSLTPNEMISQRSGIEAANGTVVIAGVGLGWFLRKVCQKEDVDKVIVVELSQELLDWYGYDLCREQPKVADVICDDIYNQIGRYGDEAKYLLDIWPTQEAVKHDRQFQHAQACLGDRIWGWGWNKFPLSEPDAVLTMWPEEFASTPRSGC